MAGIVNYVKESFEELRTNVTWTPWAEAQRLTIVVAVFSILFSLAIWGVDSFFAKILSYVYEIVLGK
ncbi:preprotein translocase subunit SecE [Kordia zhangzhouensis]|uniref:preprotein translocase subunit SecE n=1 Tax=Kordia zhangzhouensis TaxID=1620405 RepID=UPI0006293178|nr:preprotein translocase subunit SecE [Kordia zhangzhouensis]